jgi:hypothetical protein
LSAARLILVLTAIVALIGWGVFAVTTITPNPNDSNSVFGAFQASYPFQWRTDGYNLAPGSTAQFVFEITFVPNGGGCNGYFAMAWRNGTLSAFCTLPKPDSTLTSGLSDYIDIHINQDLNCCQQTYFSWVSGPSGNLTDFQSSGGFFQVNQEGNYSMHVSNTNFLPPPAKPVGNVNGTVTFSLSRVLFSRPYFAAGLATLGMAAMFTPYSLYSLSKERRKKQLSKIRESVQRFMDKSAPQDRGD